MLFCSILIHKITLTTTSSTSKPQNIRNLAVQVISELQSIQKNFFDCLYQNGLNKLSFNNCVGPNYSKVKDSYLNKYYNLKRELVQLYTNKIDHTCEDSDDICHDIRNSLEMNIKSNDNLFNILLSKRKAIAQNDGVNRELLDYLVDDFRKDFDTIEQNKKKIASALITTVNDIKSYINSTGLKFNFDYDSFDPDEVYLATGINNKEKTNVSFNEEFEKEAGAKKLLEYYLANGMVNSNNIDHAKLPSQILANIRKEKKPVGV